MSSENKIPSTRVPILYIYGNFRFTATAQGDSSQQASIGVFWTDSGSRRICMVTQRNLWVCPRISDWKAHYEVSQAPLVLALCIETGAGMWTTLCIACAFCDIMGFNRTLFLTGDLYLPRKELNPKGKRNATTISHVPMHLLLKASIAKPGISMSNV